MKKFISVGIVLFPTQGDQKMWLEKWNTFYSPKAIEFLKQNGQINQKILFEKNTDLIRTILIWEYESEEAFKKCQAFHMGQLQSSRVAQRCLAQAAHQARHQS